MVEFTLPLICLATCSIEMSCARNKMLSILQFLDSPISKENVAKFDEDSLQQTTQL